MTELWHMLTDLSAVVGWLRPLYDHWGYLIVALGAFVENTLLLGLFFPGGTMVLLGAFYSRAGALAWPLVLLLATLGTAAGVLADFLVGRLGLYRLIATTRLGKRLAPHLVKAHRFLEAHGAWAVLLGHFAGQARSGLALTAGMSGFPFGRYVLYELAAAFLYNLLYCVLGYALADNLDLLERLLRRIGAGAWALVIGLALAWLLWRFLRQAPRRPTA